MELIHPSTPPTPQADDWSLGDLYSKAYAIARKNPVLWWFSLAIAAGMGSYNSGSGGGNSSSKEDSQFFQDILNSSGSDQAAKVLGDATSPIFMIFQQIIHAIPWYFYLILGIELLALVILSIIIAVIYKAWAHAGQLSGVETSIRGEKPTMHEMSEKAFPLIKSFIWLEIVPMLLFGLLSVSLLGMLTFIFFIVPGNLKIPFGILLSLGVVTFFIGLLYLSIALIWAPRKLVTEKVSAQKAFGLGFHIAKNKFWKTLLYGFVNMIVALFVFGMAIGIPLIIFILLGGLAALLWQSVIGLSISIIMLLILLGIVWIILLTLLMGMFDSFKAAFWSLAYHKIKGKYEH